MREVSLSLLTIAMGLVMSAGGCAVGPDSHPSNADLHPDQASRGAKPPNPAGPEYGNKFERYLRAHASRPTLWPKSSKGNGRDSGVVRQVSGTLTDSGAAKSISSTFKGGVEKVSKMFAPSSRVTSVADPTSLASKATPGPNLHVATAQWYEQAGGVAEAEMHYRKGLQIAPKHLGVLLGYARLKDRRGQLDEATRLYKRAARAHPNDPAVFNDLGLCLARRGMFDESIAALERAIRLEPKRSLYRNNIAMALVEMGKIDAAVSHLKAVQSEAVAYYNVGYILRKKGQSEAAAKLFATALEKNPSLVEAKVWLEKLTGEPTPNTRPAPRIAGGRRLESRSAGTTAGPAVRRQWGDPARHSAATPLAAEPEPPAWRRPEVRQLPPVLEHRREPEARFEGNPTGPGLLNEAPLPPQTSLEEPIRGGKSERTGLPVIQPLPPVEDD